MLFEPVFAALAERNVRYLVAGGVAVVLHGHVRATMDLDLIVDVRPDQPRATIEALTVSVCDLDCQVDPLDFADPDTRAAWVAERGFLAFTMWDPRPWAGPERGLDPPPSLLHAWAHHESRQWNS